MHCDYHPANCRCNETLPGAERLVRFTVEEVVELEGVFPTGLRLVEYSPFNPCLSRQGPTTR